MEDPEDIPGSRKNRRFVASDLATGDSHPSLADASSKLADARRRNEQRSQRFNVAYTEPNAFAVLSRGEAKRLLHQREPGLVTGFAINTPEEDAKRTERAARWGVPMFDYAAEPAKAAGLTDTEVKIRQERRSRAARFGAVDELDVAIAKAAAAALADAPPASSHPEIAPVLRPKALNLRVHKYLPAASADILAYFSDFRPSFVEWLNGLSVNVLFEDEFTAKRALDNLAESVPRAPGVPEVESCWKVALKPLVKRATDKYAPAGSETTLYMRIATENDVKERSKRSFGPKSQGTYSEDGAYALHKEHDPEDPSYVASAVGAALRQAARAMEMPVAFLAAAGERSDDGPAASDRVITVVMPAPSRIQAHVGEHTGHDDRGFEGERFGGHKRRRQVANDGPLDAAACAEAVTAGMIPDPAKIKVKGRGRVAAFRGPIVSRSAVKSAGLNKPVDVTMTATVGGSAESTNVVGLE
jgi:hypothetical protein